MTLTEPARKQLDTLLKPGELLEIGLTGGGCGGATITLSKVDGMTTTGLNITGTTNVIFADQTSADILTGAELGVDESIFNAAFVVTPPKGVQSCGCGASIKLEPK